eukprot:3526891-Alexandrium_andersonii.AAC.1
MATSSAHRAALIPVWRRAHLAMPRIASEGAPPIPGPLRPGRLGKGSVLVGAPESLSTLHAP